MRQPKNAKYRVDYMVQCTYSLNIYFYIHNPSVCSRFSQQYFCFVAQSHITFPTQLQQAHTYQTPLSLASHSLSPTVLNFTFFCFTALSFPSMHVKVCAFHRNLL